MKKFLKILVFTLLFFVLAIVTAFFVVRQEVIPFEKIEAIANGIYEVVEKEVSNNSKEGKDGASFKDPRDGKIYKTVKIGTQVWMAQNINYNIKGSRCYGNKEEVCAKYGRLYSWFAAKAACPVGWHLPDNKDWDILAYFAGGGDVAGKSLKAAGGWNGNGNGEDKFGFAALPGGSYNGNFIRFGFESEWWSATESNGWAAYSRTINDHSKYIYNGTGDKSLLYSVRCLQNAAQPKASAAGVSDKLLEETIVKTLKAIQNKDEKTLNQLLHKDIGIVLITSDDFFTPNFRSRISFSDPLFDIYKMPFGKTLNINYKVQFGDLPLWYCSGDRWTKPTGIYCFKNKFIWEEETMSGMARNNASGSETKIIEILDSKSQHYNVRAMDKAVGLPDWDNSKLNRIDFTLTLIDGKLYLTLINMYYYCRPWN